MGYRPRPVPVEKTSSFMKTPESPFIMLVCIGVLLFFFGCYTGTIGLAALGGTMAAGCGIKGFEVMLADTKAKELESKVTEFDCSEYEQHTLDQKMADAGIMKRDEITLCDNHKCPLCKTERERRGNELLSIKPRPPRGPSGVSVRTPRYNSRNTCERCGVYSRMNILCEWCSRRNEYYYEEIIVEQMLKPIATYSSDHKQVQELKTKRVKRINPGYG